MEIWSESSSLYDNYDGGKCMKYYLAYGSNLNKEQMKHRCPSAVPVGTAIIDDYQLVFRGNIQGVLTIESKKDSSVPVGIWLITERCERALDIYEGYPSLYRKEYIKINHQGKIIDALIYIMNRALEIVAPSFRYLDIVVHGYKDFGFELKPIYQAISNFKVRVIN